MPSQFVVLDESKSEKHPILSVGGIVVNADDIPEIEREWAAMKRATNLADRPVKYSMTWPNAALRIHLLGQIGRLPVRAIAALLEDFRPLRMNAKRETRAEAYVHLKAFEYVLQRLPEEVFHDSACVPNFVVLDHRSDFKLFADRYGKHHRVDWSFASGRTVPSLGSVGYATGLHHSHDGALNEIADMTISCITRWVGARAAAHRGKAVAEVDELDREAAAIIDLFPCSPTAIPTRRQGYSLITFKDNRTGKEVLAANIDRWARDLADPPAADAEADDDIPF
jgi:hypothetical protein